MARKQTPFLQKSLRHSKCICFQSAFTDVFSHSCPGDGTNAGKLSISAFCPRSCQARARQSQHVCPTEVEGISPRPHPVLLLCPDSICGGPVLWWSWTVTSEDQHTALCRSLECDTPWLDLHLADAETRLRLQFFYHLKYFVKADAVNKTLNWKALILFSSF